MDNAPSFASLLVKESPRMHYSHGWIDTEGKRWHPSRDQSELLKGLTTKKAKKPAYLIIRIARFILKGVKHVAR